MARSSVVLPAPFAPSSATISPGGTREAHAAQHQHHVVVDDLEVLHLQHAAPLQVG